MREEPLGEALLALVGLIGSVVGVSFLCYLVLL